LESEQFRTEADLAGTYAGLFAPALEHAFGDVRVRAHQIGAGAAGSFHGAFLSGDRAFAFVGRVREEAALDAAVVASAATRLLERELPVPDPGRTLAEVAELFSCETLECVFWHEGSDAVERWSMTAGAEAPVRQGLPLTWRAPLVLHTLGAEAGSVIDQYLSFFGHMTAEDAFEEIAAALPPGRAGSLMLLQRSTPITAEGSCPERSRA
jgi:hypothetical protein